MLYNGEETSSRFQVLDRPMQLPGTCSVCGNPDGQVIDFGLSLDFYGCVYICIVCLNAAAEKAGLFEARGIEVALNKQLLGGISLLRTNLNEITGAEDGLMAAIQRFNTVVNGILNVSGIPDQSSPSDSTDEPKSDESDGQDVGNAGSEGSVSVSTDSSNESESIATISRFSV